MVHARTRFKTCIPKAKTVLKAVIVIDRDKSPLSRYEYMLLAPPPGQHPATNIPRATADISIWTDLATANAI